VSADIEALRPWIGRREITTDTITVPSVQRIAALLDHPDASPGPGDLLPVGWHLLYCPSVVAQSKLGPDGHPRKGGFIPPIEFPCRMAAGLSIGFHAELRIGDLLRREAVIDDVAIKRGDAGEMVFVTIKAEISSPRGLCVTEEQRAVFRPAAESVAPAPPPRRNAWIAPVAQWKRTVVPDPVMVFRYAAVSFSGHRIHYDFPYATTVEGYPGVMVSGGLSTLLIFDLARHHAPRPISRFESRNLRPLYVDHPMDICGAITNGGDRATFWITDEAGTVAVRAEAVLA
jgi:3-methylfumaryl-CoA hydratase